MMDYGDDRNNRRVGLCRNFIDERIGRQVAGRFRSRYIMQVVQRRNEYQIRCGVSSGRRCVVGLTVEMGVYDRYAVDDVTMFEQGGVGVIADE